jgi:methionyl-tRNA formyltransferase
MRIAICIKRDLYGVLALRAFAAAAGPGVYRVFCSVKTRAVEHAVPQLALLKTLERDAAMNPLFWSPGPILPEGVPPPTDWEDLIDLRADGGGARLLDWRPDLVLSMRFSLIFPGWLIARVPAGIINVHPGPLPAHRGLFAPFWQALQGTTMFGCAVHFVDSGIDTGPVIDTARVPLAEDRSLMWHAGELYRGGARIAAAAVDTLRRGAVPAATPPAPGGAYRRFPDAADFAALEARGMRLVDARDYAALIDEIFAPAGRR